MTPYNDQLALARRWDKAVDAGSPLTAQTGYLLSDTTRLSQPMGQFQNWYDKLFYWSGEALGWRYLKGLT